MKREDVSVTQRRELVLATGNEHKRRELSGILTGWRVLLPRELGIEFEHEETGDTYFENSYGKAMTLYHALVAAGRPRIVIADDSGLSVAALDGAPGIHSARYGARDDGTQLSAAEKNGLLLERMKGKSNRQAFFVCCMVLVSGPYRFASAQETWEGEIALEPSTAAGGFGYDPVFLLPNRGVTAADLPEQEKNRLSHRAQAARKILRLLDK